MFPYQNPALSAAERAEDLLARMTVEEKIGQTVMEIVCAFPDEKSAVEKVRSGCFGSFILSTTAFPGNLTASGINIAFLNRCQKAAVEESRLGIPLIFGRDVIHGHYTVAPIPLAQAASFNPACAEESAQIAATECRAESVHWTFAPMMDICRDPRWGRVIECFGEDPYLASKMAEGAIRGYQGADPEHIRVAACAKHFAGYGFAEGGRDYDCAEISRYTMLNTVLAPFRAAVKKAHAASIMTSFQVTGGTPSSSDEFLLRDTLRRDWKFDGAVVSDFGSVDEVELHGAAQDERDGAKKSFHAGVDIEMCNNLYPKYLPGLIASGEIPMEDLDRAVRAVLIMKFRAGLFENPYTDENAGKTVAFTQENRDAVRRIAAECMVLAKNENRILPLTDVKGKKILLIGPMVHERASLRGAWCGNGSVKDTATFAEAFQEILGDSAAVDAPVSALADEQIRRIRFNDIVVCCLGESSACCGETHASARFALPPGQEVFLEEVLAQGKDVIVLIASGRPLPVPAAERDAKAILYAWHCGTETARAAADIVFGRAEPGGRFPMTVPRSVGQIPLYYGRKRVAKLTKEFLIRQNYHFYDDSPLEGYHSFGSGLSWTDFACGELKLDRSTVSAGGSVVAVLPVTNTGDRAGHAVVQCYLHDVRASYARPGKELCGFEKVLLAPGETREVSFEITPEAMGFYDETGAFQLEPGRFEVGAGLSSDVALTAEFEVK